MTTKKKDVAVIKKKTAKKAAVKKTSTRKPKVPVSPRGGNTEVAKKQTFEQAWEVVTTREPKEQGFFSKLFSWLK